MAATTDVVARLRLNGEAFSSEVGKRMAEMTSTMAANARRMSTDIRGEFGGAFAEVQRLAGNALKMPRTAGGSLDLSGEIASLKTAEAATLNNVNALRELEHAARRAAAAGREDAQALLLKADAAQTAAAADELALRKVRENIGALEALQTELGRSATVTNAHAAAGRAVVVSAGQQRAAMQQLSFQANDVATQFSMGTPIMQIFAQQSGQVFQALAMLGAGARGASGAVTAAAGASQEAGVDIGGLGDQVVGVAEKAEGMQGRLGAAAAFMAGPWGAAVLVGVSLLTPFVAKLFEAGDAVESETEKLRESAAQARVTAAAKDAFRQTTEGVTAAIDAQVAATKRLIAINRTQAERENINTLAAVDNNRGKRSEKAGELAEAERYLKSVERLAVYDDTGSQATLRAAQDKVANLRREIARLDTSIARGSQAVERSRLALAAERAKDVDDATKAINKRFDAEVDREKARVESAIRNGRTVGGATQRVLEDIQRRRAAAHEAESKRQQQRLNAEREIARAGRGDVPTAAQLSSVIKDVLPGARITSTTGGRHVRGSHHYQNRAVDFVPAGGMGSVSKADVRRQLEAAGLTIDELLGPGDKGHSDHFHVSVTKGKAALEDFTEQQRESREEAEKSAQALHRLQDRYDLMGAALREYNDDLKTLELAGKTDKFAPGKYRPFVDQTYDEKRRSILGITSASTSSVLAGGENALEARLSAAGEKFTGEIMTGMANSTLVFVRDVSAAGEYLREAVARGADLFGVRIQGPLAGLLQPGGIEGQAGAIAKAIGMSLTRAGIKIDQGSIDKIGGVLTAASYGQVGGSVFASITGGRENKLASSIGGVLGNEAGKALGGMAMKAVGGKLGEMLGSAGGPIGSIVGGILGNVVGGLFQKAPKGSAGIVSTGGVITAGAASGTTADAKSGAATLAGGVATALSRIAELLGAKVTGTTDVQIGMYKDMIRVNATGGAVGGVRGSGALTFGSEEAAIAFAVSDALKDGVLSGISAASLKILQAGKDLQSSIEKALMIERIPRDLKAALDPVGAAIDELNRKWEKTVEALNEGGATAEQMAQAQQLYQLQLDQTRASTESASRGLKEFRDSLKVGGASPLSLRDQSAAARAQLEPMLALIQSGGRVDQQKYQTAAQSFLDVQRQLYGSSEAFFRSFDEIQGATNRLISTIDNVVPVTPAVENPFVKATAAATQRSAEALHVANEQRDRTNALLERLSHSLDRIEAGGGANDGGFIGDGRGFTSTLSATGFR